MGGCPVSPSCITPVQNEGCPGGSRYRAVEVLNRVSGRPAAVDVDGLAGDEAGFV